MDAVTPGRPSGDAAPWEVRPMAVGDVGAVVAVIDAANDAQAEAGLSAPRPARTEAEGAAIHLAHARFVERDRPGAWVAVSAGRVVGVAESIRRSDFWGLSMLFVHPEFQNRGVGGRLLEAALSYAEGASKRMIQSSPDPRAIRRYSLAGLAMHPAAELGGRPDRRAVPRSLPGREGGEDELDLVAAVEGHLGRSRTEDVAFALSDERFRLDVVDHGSKRGWVLWRPNRLVMLGATDEHTAKALVWRFVAGAEEGDELAYGLTAAQQWAFAVAHEARLSVRVGGAMFVGGMEVPAPWIPSGWYF